MEHLTLPIRSLDYHVRLFNKDGLKKIVLLHGFTGSMKTWEEVIEELPNSLAILAIDLIGHGKTAKPLEASRYSVEEQIEDLRTIFDQIGWKDFILVGYSMGGRLALSYANKYSVAHLILESSSPGVQDKEAREQRIEADSNLAAMIEKEGIESFVEYWGNIPLFLSQKKLSLKKRRAIREERVSQEEIGLANSLRGFSTGIQPSLWDKLDSMIFPVTLVTGAEDKKFCEIAKKMEEILPNVKRITVKEVGHAIHVENPKLFATIVKEIILKEELK